ncbi:MAG: amidohydrolase [Acidobacteriales bacterium]|nr:amidohydrolase [Terriglobales bacterium]
MKLVSLLFLLVSLCSFAFDADQILSDQVASVYPKVERLYMDLHQYPELALEETRTAAKLADALRSLGYEVTTGVGGNGVVALLKNGPGLTVMLRTELDALPVEEKTDLPFASKVRVKDSDGAQVAVMHACGHDVHMASLVGAAALMANNRKWWRGTLMLVGQPAEEIVTGAKAMLHDGLFTRFPKPQYAFAVHATNLLPAGKVGFTPGYSHTSADAIDVTIFGKGGHGAMPHATVDPVVIAARAVLALQTIVSRETNPQDPAIITVGSIHGGTKHNIIPDQVKLQLTVRAYKPEVREHLLAAINRIVRAEAEAANAPRAPEVKVLQSTPAQFDEPKLVERLAALLRQKAGTDNVVPMPPWTPSDDFALFPLAGVPSAMFMLGIANPAKFEEAKKSGVVLPSNHSPFFAPDYGPTLRTAILVQTAALLELLKDSAGARNAK